MAAGNIICVITFKRFKIMVFLVQVLVAFLWAYVSLFLFLSFSKRLRNGFRWLLDALGRDDAK